MSRSTSRALVESRELSAKLFRVGDRARADFAALASEFDLTVLQARTLLWLEQPSAMRDLAEHLRCDASNVTGLADRLGALGVVERVSGTDRRVKMLQLTPEGTELRERLAARVAEGSTVRVMLTAAERADLHRLLDRLLGED